MNFFYAAQTYFDEWISFDRQAMKVLNFNSDSRPCAEEACKQLVSVATHYGIVRNFRRAYDCGETRLHGVWEVLKDVEKPVSEQSAKDAVEALVAGLKSRYRQDLLSAASKFLWMRFGTPVVIYDSLTWGQLCQKPHPQCRGYGDFYDAWQKSFLEHKEEIIVACEALEGLSESRKFFSQTDISVQDFRRAVSAHWFAERVFDHALLNEAQRVTVETLNKI